MRFSVEILVSDEEVTPEEMEGAMRDALRTLYLPNGDTLYVDMVNVYAEDADDSFGVGASHELNKEKP